MFDTSEVFIKTADFHRLCCNYLRYFLYTAHLLIISYKPCLQITYSQVLVFYV